jgi:short-subunit dehydrogenase
MKHALSIAGGVVGGLVGARWMARWRRRINLRRKVVLITGGSRGLGLELARAFADEGSNIVICARGEAELARARRDLQKHYSTEILAVQCDVTVKNQVDGMVEGVLKHFGRIDVLVNNAGVIQCGPMQVMTLDDYVEAMQAHFWAPLYTSLAVLPQMLQRRFGRIVNISSIGGIVSVPHLLPYCASKFALTGFSEGMRAELMQDGVYVTTVCPGLMRTGSPRNAFFKGRHEAEYAMFIISDSLPGIAMDSRRAARRIVRAAKYGESEVILTLAAQVAARLHGLAPGLVSDLYGMVNRLLPQPGGIGSERRYGYESESAMSRSFLTTLTQRAAERNNQLVHGDGRHG